MSSFTGRSRRHDDRLSVDHLSHDPARRIRRGHQNRIQVKLQRGDSLQVAKEDVARRIRAGQSDSQPAQSVPNSG